jgi:hypothetical protein
MELEALGRVRVGVGGRGRGGVEREGEGAVVRGHGGAEQGTRRARRIRERRLGRGAGKKKLYSLSRVGASNTVSFQLIQYIF